MSGYLVNATVTHFQLEQMLADTVKFLADLDCVCQLWSHNITITMQ